MVSSPRNQRYLQPPVIRPGVLVCEADEGGKLAEQFDLEFAFLRYQTDLIDQGSLTQTKRGS